jgi:predicted RNA binding protein YcfA (HicA-like mRNA interferase family)
VASLTYRELRRRLEDIGCRYVRDARHGGHEIWHCPDCKPLSVPKTLKGEGTLQSILKAAGITTA